MPEFAEFQQNAKLFAKKLMQSYSRSLGCFSFFTAMTPQIINDSAMSDAVTLSLIAESLDENHDNLLQYIKDHIIPNPIEKTVFDDFRGKVLVGMYLLVWSKYNSTIDTYWNKHLIKLLQNDLNLHALHDMDDYAFDDCLSSLSLYSSFIYCNRNEYLYTNLNQRLGLTIQLDIHTLRNSKNNDSPFSYLSGIMCTFGQNTRS